MIDVFLCHVPGTHLRNSMYNLCRIRWEGEGGARIRHLNPKRLGVTAYEFQRSRRIFADDHAESEIYVVADDDILLEADPVVGRGETLMKAYPDFAVLSLAETKPDWKTWVPDWPEYKAFHDEAVTEHVSVGGVRFCRRGAVKSWPPMDEGIKTYDHVHGQAVRDAGYRSGYFKHLHGLHLGRGYSTIWP